MSQAERLFYIDTKVRERGGVTLRDVAERFEVSTRQVRRDLDYLTDRLGAPLEWNPASRRYEYRESWNGLDFADEKALLFYVFVRAAAGTLAYVPLVKDAALGRLLELVPPQLRSAAEAIRYELPAYEPADIEKLGLLLRALAEGRCVDASYRDAGGKASARRLEVLRLVNYGGNWYCVSFDHASSALRTFRLSRFAEISLSRDKAGTTVPAEELDRFLGASYGMFKGAADKTAVMRFRRRALPIVRSEVWHPEQRREEGRDGGGDYLELSVPVSSWSEILGRLLRFGADAEAVAPEEFRGLWTEEIRRMAAILEER